MMLCVRQKTVKGMEEETAEPRYKTVCGSAISDPTSYPSAQYRGGEVYFCTRACLRVFKLDPDPFVAGEVEHPHESD